MMKKPFGGTESAPPPGLDRIKSLDCVELNVVFYNLQFNGLISSDSARSYNFAYIINLNNKCS